MPKVENQNGYQPLISVIMPTYNRHSMVGRAIESIRLQTFCNWELIIIDDGSTDETPSIISQVAENDRRIRIITNRKNSGIVRSLNRGINAASGKFIARADDDDISLPTRFDEQMNFLLKFPEIDAVGTAAHLLDRDGNKCATTIPDSDPESIYKNRFRKPVIFHPSGMFRAQFFKKYGLYSEYYKRAEDKELWLRALSKGAKFSNIENPLLEYHTNNFELSMKSIKDDFYSNLKLSIEYKSAQSVFISFYSTIVLILVKFRLIKHPSLTEKNRHSGGSRLRTH